MDKINMVVEDNTLRNDSGTPVAKSFGGLRQVESISIDLNIPMPIKKEGNCQHFSLR